MRKIIAFILLFLGMLSIAEPVLACEPPPSSYLDCDDLGKGYQFGFRFNTARNGTYHFTSKYGALTGGAPSDNNNSVKISNSDSRTFDWSASLGIDAVIVQAGGKSTIIKLSEEKSGKRFHGKTYSNGKPYSIDKLYFCYDYELDVSVESKGSGSNSTAWAIAKNVDTVVQDKFAGEKAVFNYTVAVHKVAGEQIGNTVTSTLKITNSSPLTAKITSIKEVLDPGDITTELDCGNITFPYRLGAKKELTCTSKTPVKTRVEDSTVVVRTSNSVGGGKATAKIAWDEGGPPAAADPGSITVTDTNTAFGGPYVVTGDKTWTYAVELACPVDPAAYSNGQQTTTLENTAAITETGQNASQSVQLNCYAPTLANTTSISYDVAYTWAITKTSPIQHLTLQVGETASVDYTVGVSVAGQDKTNYKVSGSVTINNPHPKVSLAATLLDEIAPGIPAELVDCANPITVPAAGTLTCKFEGTAGTGQIDANTARLTVNTARLTVNTARLTVNTARLTMNNITFTTTTPYDFQNAAKNEIDECVTVTDDALPNPLGTVCADKTPGIYNYSLLIGPYAQCRETSTSYLNAAVFIANDTGNSGYANWEVIIDIPCPADTNCTRPTEYWQAHADPANRTSYNVTWDKIQPNGPDSPFFTTGFTWVHMIQSDPVNNVYNQLAQEYIAAVLNTLYGAAAPAEVSASIDHASSVLAQYATSQGEITGDIAQDFIETATTLNKFNNGKLGPALCYDCNE